MFLQEKSCTTDRLLSLRKEQEDLTYLAWWLKPNIIALGGLQKDCHKYETSLGFKRTLLLNN